MYGNLYKTQKIKKKGNRINLTLLNSLRCIEPNFSTFRSLPQLKLQILERDFTIL